MVFILVTTNNTYLLNILQIHISSMSFLFFFPYMDRLVFSRFLDLRGNLGIVKEKPTRKTCFSREKKSLAPRIYQAKFCLGEFLWSQRNLYYIFTRNRCIILKRGRVYLKRFNYKSFIKGFIKDSLWKLYKSFIKVLWKSYMFTSF